MTWQKFLNGHTYIGDDTTRTVQVIAPEGDVIQVVPYTVEENAAADAAITEANAAANQQIIEKALTASLATLQTIIDDTNANINSNPAARIKDLARVQRRLIRLATRRFDGTT